jgi:hypothetical protein
MWFSSENSMKFNRNGTTEKSENSEEGVHIDHEIAPYLGEDRAILPVEGTFR